MEKEFVPYELAVKLKELGFNEHCIATYDEDKNFELQDFFQTYETFPSHIISAPTFSQAFRWFDYSTEWSGFIVPSKEEGCFEWWIQNYEDPNYLTIESDDWYRGREEAELACLSKLIEIVEQKEK